MLWADATFARINIVRLADSRARRDVGAGLRHSLHFPSAWDKWDLRGFPPLATMGSCITLDVVEGLERRQRAVQRTCIYDAAGPRLIEVLVFWLIGSWSTYS